jgi:type II secretory pathway pseudopilin PulG
MSGFTLLELGIVIAIIGILISLILVASQDGIRRAEERQTQALIIKLETAYSERLDALLATSAPLNQTHRYLAAITYLDPSGNNHIDPIPASVDRRAQVIAQFDFLKAELPDVFYTNNINASNTINDASYPFNFGMPPFPLNATAAFPGQNLRDAYALPLGNRLPGLPYITNNPGSAIPTYVPTPGFNPLSGYNDLYISSTNLPVGLIVAQDSGIYGASFTAMASLTKNLYESAANNLGTNPAIIAKYGYDAVDNDKDGYIDNIGEVTPGGGQAATNFQTQVNAQLAKHNHKTARAEMLYALLVEGQGPLGSSFNPSDFTSRDVADTDGDGMPEFIDAWGQPLQFYRWPIFYGQLPAASANVPASNPSDSQMGFSTYTSQQRRQLDPLDPNQLLTSLAWWGSSNGGFAYMQPPASPLTGFPASSGPAVPSAQAYAFMTYFHIIIDPQTASTSQNVQMWDRTGNSRRRAYYSKFLVLSGGPDKEIGVFQLNKDYLDDIGLAAPTNASLSPAVVFPTGNPTTDAQLVNWCESQAAQVEFTGRLGTFYEQVAPVVTSPTSRFLQQNAGLDDLSNHALSAPGTGAK